MDASEALAPVPAPCVEIELAELARLEAWAFSGYPRETAALLVGRVSPGHLRVEAAVPVRNAEVTDPFRRVRASASSFHAVDRWAASSGRDVVGFFHSHPDGTATLSDFDREDAPTGLAYLVLPVRGAGVGSLAAWCLPGGVRGPVELPVRSVPDCRPGARPPGEDPWHT